MVNRSKLVHNWLNLGSQRARHGRCPDTALESRYPYCPAHEDFTHMMTCPSPRAQKFRYDGMMQLRKVLEEGSRHGPPTRKLSFPSKPIPSPTKTSSNGRSLRKPKLAGRMPFADSSASNGATFTRMRTPHPPTSADHAPSASWQTTQRPCQITRCLCGNTETQCYMKLVPTDSTRYTRPSTTTSHSCTPSRKHSAYHCNTSLPNLSTLASVALRANGPDGSNSFVSRHPAPTSMVLARRYSHIFSTSTLNVVPPPHVLEM